MELNQKVVLMIPLTELWTDKECLPLARGKQLASKDISELLRQQKIQFVIANVGNKLQWTPADNCYEFYKTIKTKIIENLERIDLNQFKNECSYLATLWSTEGEYPIVLLEMYH